MARVPLPPGPYYKYMESRWGRQMVEKGDVRIGTLYGYKTFEQHGGNIYDAEEGVRRLGLIKIANVRDRHREVEHLKLVGIGIEGGPGVIDGFSNTSTDRYIYSFSSELSSRCASACHEGYDSVVILWDVKELIRRINGRLRNIKRLQGVAAVVYTEKLPLERVVDVPSALVKLPKFKAQKEYRAIWIAESLPIEPQYINVGPLSGISSFYYLEDFEQMYKSSQRPLGHHRSR